MVFLPLEIVEILGTDEIKFEPQDRKG